jgi:hypothetical protein
MQIRLQISSAVQIQRTGHAEMRSMMHDYLTLTTAEAVAP